jgi:MtaA/CmuA family methyltransferase
MIFAIFTVNTSLENTMTKREKLERLLNDGRSDYTLFHPILMHFAARFHKKTYSEFASDYRAFVESNAACAEHFDLDAVMLVSDPYRETSAFGAKVEFPIDSVPICREKIIRTTEDVRALKNPDVHNAERTRDRILGASYYRQVLGDGIPVIGWIEGPLAEACDLVGVNEILLALALEPDFVRLVMDKCLITAKDFARAQIEAGCTVMAVGDAICSQISPSMYESFVLPLHQELFAFIHSLGAPVKLHICGNITHLLPALARAGADIIDLDWMVDMTGAHSILGNRIVLSGNLNPVSVIQDYTADRLFETTKELVLAETGKPFILSGGCEITVNTPVENLKNMRLASR